MIEQISFKNFKGFSELKDLKIKPITVLCGTNSCGKSTILQNILLLKQTLESSNSEENFLLNGKFVHLGTFENIIFEKKLENDLTFEYKAKLNRNTIGFRGSHMVSNITPDKDCYSKDVEIYYKMTFTNKEGLSRGDYIKSAKIKEIVLNMKPISKGRENLPAISIEIHHQENENYLVKWERCFGYRSGEKISKKDFDKLQTLIPNTKKGKELKKLMGLAFKFDKCFRILFIEKTPITINYSDNYSDVEEIFNKAIKNFTKPLLFDLFPNTSIEVERFKKDERSVKINFRNLFPSQSFTDMCHACEYPYTEIMEIIYSLRDIFTNIFSSYTYIGPLREEPSRRYIYEDEILEIGVKGENAAYIYHKEKEKSIENHYFYDINSNTFKKNKKMKLSDALKNWLELMNINNFSTDLYKEIIYLSLDANSSENVKVNIADVGFGVSQIFPIILEGLRMPLGNTLLLEQPEIHLHPKLQMQMADYFISLALSGKKVIVETHSDHIINRLVRRIVEDNTYNLKDLIAIYFITPTENGAKYEEICIDDEFGIVNWPQEFFDQASSEQEKIMRAGIKKSKEKKG